MKISYNWLKELLPLHLTPQETARILNEIGLEVEAISEFSSHKGLENVVVGEVLEKQKHPNADKLSLTKVTIGQDKVLSIVCGAPNVEVGQKVMVALVGAQLHTHSGEVIDIKKSKIRGEISEGMICSEAELGISDNHAGIMVLPKEIPAGLSAIHYFKVEKDVVFEIGLTANRGDAASHIGIARDLKAYLKTHFEEYQDLNIRFPASLDFPEPSNTINIDIEVKNIEDCKRYAGIVINGVKVAPSPQWLQNRLTAVGIRPINNIVDITNYVMLELGQPLHAFDVSAIKGNKVIVQNLKDSTEFTTLDNITRKLTATDLMICNSEEPMCIAGIMGGKDSGIKESTQSIFIESAWFNPSAIRKTSTRLGLKTDASFRFERFADPDMVIFALNRACSLILEIAGGSLSMGVKDIYPDPIQPHKVGYSIRHASDLFGQDIPFETTKKIIEELEIQIESESHEGMLLLIPPRKSDVIREVDVAEEVLRIYGFNAINVKKQVSYPLPEKRPFDKTQWTNYLHNISKLLVNKGFYETQTLSFHHHAFYQNTDTLIKILNPVTAELDVLRGNLLFSALQTISFNERHQQKNISGFEIGKRYQKISQELKEETILSIFTAGKIPLTESFYNQHKEFYYLKDIIRLLLDYSHCSYSIQQTTSSENHLTHTIQFFVNTNQLVAEVGFTHPTILKKFDISLQPVIYAEVYLEKLFTYYQSSSITYTDIPRFPIVERDLSLLIDKHISYEQIKKVIRSAAKPYLLNIEMFDYYQGKNIPEGKKSYAVKLFLQDASKTLTDKEIENIMNKTIHHLKEELNITLR